MADKDSTTETGGNDPKTPARSGRGGKDAAYPGADPEETAREVTRVATDTVSSAVASGLERAPGVSTDLTSELNNIDFRTMIGGPLQAAVDAQVASSLATVDFISKVGFAYPVGDDGEPDTSKPRELVMVDFTHTRDDGELDDAGNPVVQNVTVKVPLLAMLPIPSLRIEHVVIDFNVKLNSVQSASTSDALGVNAEVKGGWGPVNLKVSASYQRKTATNVEVKKEYALNVNVKAVQDEIPAGLEKILNILAA